MSSTKTPLSVLPEGEPVFTIPEAAEHMGVLVTRLIQKLKNHEIIAVYEGSVAYLPQRYFNKEGELNRFVPGLTALLVDGSYTDQEIITYMFTEDDTLPGRPIDALHGHLAREVMRRAQAMAF